jgi:uncharacterized protein
MSAKTPTEERLMSDLKTAMKARDKATIAAIRMVRSRIGEKRTAKGAKELDDAAVLAVIQSYTKSLAGAVEDFRKGGTPDDDPAIADLYAEIALLQPYLPKLLDEAATAAIVDAVIAAHGLSGVKAIGRVMGMVMKDHKGEVDAGLVKRLAAAKLAGQGG